MVRWLVPGFPEPGPYITIGGLGMLLDLFCPPVGERGLQITRCGLGLTILIEPVICGEAGGRAGVLNGHTQLHLGGQLRHEFFLVHLVLSPFLAPT